MTLCDSRPQRGLRRLTALGLAAALQALAAAQPNPAQLDVVDEAVAIQDRRGAAVPLDLRFRDESGAEVRLGDYMRGDRPVILDLAYYGCPQLCGAVMQGMAEGLRGVRLKLGTDYEIVSVSFDPSETPGLAQQKKAAFAAEWVDAPVDAHWHFLTAPDDQARKLAETVGFGYQWNQFGKQWDHGPGIFVLSPTGVLTQTLYGLYFEPRDLRLALVEASAGKVGTAWDRILLSCYGYDPKTRSYSLLVTTVVRIGGVITVLAIAAMLIVLFRRERRRVAAATT